MPFAIRWSFLIRFIIKSEKRKAKSKKRKNGYKLKGKSFDPHPGSTIGG